MANAIKGFGFLLAMGLAALALWAQQAIEKKDLKWTGVIRGRITPSQKVRLIAAYNRKEAINPKAKMDVPETPFKGQIDERGYFQIGDLPEDTYDLVLLTTDGARIEGFHLTLSREHEELEEGMADQYEDADAPDEDDLEENEVELDETGKPIPKKPKDPNREIPEEVEEALTKHIRKMELYENKHRPLYMIGNKRRATVLMELVRDRFTTFDADPANPFKAPIATVRYEIWQFTNWHGGWTRDQEFKLLHRIIMAKEDFRKQTWIWEKSLGGLVVKKGAKPAYVEYQIPERYDPRKGLTPY